MSDLKPIAYISCNLTNKDAVVLTNQNGVVLTGADPDDYRVIGYYHSEGAQECDDWMNWNRELVDSLNKKHLQSLDTAISPAQSPIFQDEDQGTALSEEDDSSGDDSKKDPEADSDYEIDALDDFLGGLIDPQGNS